MSGGSWSYFYEKLDEVADRLIYEGCPTCGNANRGRLGKLAKLMAVALHDIEWVDSSDYGNGGEDAAIDEVFKFLEKEQTE